MNLQTLSDVLLWCAVLNYALLLWWWLMFVFARDWVRRLHGRWFRLDDASFDAIHYGAMAAYKLCIFMFNLTPWLALRIAA